jgi:ABC-type phosphate transport system substrate-binding protein
MMRKRLPVAFAAAGLAAAAVFGTPLCASAQTTPNCSSYTNPVYISGSSASQPVLQALATVLQTSVAIIYQNPDSCLGLNDALSNTASTEAGVKTQYLDPVNGAVACLPDSPTPQTPDIGVSDVFLQTCETAGTVTAPTQKIVEVEGPIQAMTFAVPALSSASSISARAAYVLFGYDAQYPVATWTQPANVFVRANTSGTLNMLGTAIGLSSSKWANAETSVPDGGAIPTQQQSSTGNEFNAISKVTSNADATIGILSYEAVEQDNAKAAASNPAQPTVKILPYQHTGQTCGYLPDSTQTSLDRINVRQGRYDVWGPLHFVVSVDANGYPLGHNPDAIATVLNYFIATGPNGTGMTDATAPVQVAPFTIPSSDAGVASSGAQALITAEATVSQGGVVPWCAMQVVRTSEVGPEASYQPGESCGCFFEKTATGAPVQSYCKSCTDDTGCAATPSFPKCRFGYCEAQ